MIFIILIFLKPMVLKKYLYKKIKDKIKLYNKSKPFSIYFLTLLACIFKIYLS